MTIRFARLALGALLCVSFAVVAKEPLAVHAPDQNPQPEPGKALVVFMRPSSMAGGVSSSVYVAPDEETQFIGVVRRRQKMAYQADPGPNRFMVIAENADFMDATLEAGKTYYVLISPRPGFWKARFSLFPIHNHADPGESMLNPDFREWDAKTSLVTTSPAGLAWYEDNKASVAEKKADYLAKWNRMAASDRAELTLHAEDGVPAQVATEAPAAATAATPAPAEASAADAEASEAPAGAEATATDAAAQQADAAATEGAAEGN